MRKLIALLIILAGAGGGIALGLQFRAGGATPAATSHGAAAAPDAGGAGGSGGHAAAATSGHGGGNPDDHDYVKIGRQIIVPVVSGRETRALMMFELALDVPRGMTDRAYSVEPRLRDAFLRELFELSYTGAFMTTYTDERVVAELRGNLLRAARRILGQHVAEVLILGIMRQEL